MKSQLIATVVAALLVGCGGAQLFSPVEPAEPVAKKSSAAVVSTSGELSGNLSKASF